MADEDAVANIYKKIEREKALLNAANAMLAQTDNDSVRSRLNSQIRDGRRNVQFFEEKLRELQMRRVNSGMDNMSLRSGEAADDDGSGPPPPPPKDAGSWEHTRSGSSASASYGSAQYGKPGPHGGDLVPPKHPYAPPGPGSSAPKTRPNFTKLGVF
jgi:classical protein kinase C